MCCTTSTHTDTHWTLRLVVLVPELVVEGLLVVV